MPPKPVGSPRAASGAKARTASPRTAAGSPSPAARPAGKGAAASPTPGARAPGAAGTATAPRTTGPAKTPGAPATGPAAAGGASKAPGSAAGAKGPGAAGPAKNPTPSGSRPGAVAGAPPARNPDGTPRSSAPPTPASRPGGPPPGKAPASHAGDSQQQSSYGGPPGLHRQQSMGPNSTANRQSPPPPAAQGGGPSNAGPKSPPPPPPQQQQQAPASSSPVPAAAPPPPTPTPAPAETKPPTRRFVAGASNVIFDVWWSLAPPRAVKADAYFKGSARAPPAVTHVQTIDRSRSRFGVLPGVPQAGSESSSRRGNPVPGVGAFTGQGRKLLKDPNHPQQALLDRARDQTEYELNEDLLFCEQRVKAAKGIVEDTKAKQQAGAASEASPSGTATNSAPPAGNIPAPPGRASPIPPPPPRAVAPVPAAGSAPASSPTNESVDFKLKLAEQSLDQWQVARTEAESRVQAIPFSLEQTKKIVSCASRTACRIARAAYWRWHAVYLRRKRWSERMDILRRTTRNTHMRGTWHVWRSFVSTASRQRREREEADRVHALTMSRWEASVQSHQDRVNDLQRAIGIKKHVLQLHRESFAPGLERRPAAFAEWKDREQQLEKEIMLLQAELASAVDAFFEVRRHAPEHPLDQQQQQQQQQSHHQQSMSAAHNAYTAPSPHRTTGARVPISQQPQRARQLPVSAPDAAPYTSFSAAHQAGSGSPRRFQNNGSSHVDTANAVSREEESLMYARAEAAHWRQRCLEMEARGRDDEGRQPSVSQAPRGGSLEMDEPSISPVHPSHGGSYGTPHRAGRRSPVRAPIGRPQASPVAAYPSNGSGSFSAASPPPPQSRPPYHQDPYAPAGPPSPSAYDHHSHNHQQQQQQQRQRGDASAGGDWNASGSHYHHNQPQAYQHSQHVRPAVASPAGAGSPYSVGRHNQQASSPLMPGTVYADEQCVVVRMD